MSSATTDKIRYPFNPINKGILCIYNVMNGEFPTQGEDHG